MAYTKPNQASVLAEAFTQRIAQLGLSRRELVRRTGLSRQTLHNVERGGKTELRPQTLAALDRGLHWRPGTALALSQGNPLETLAADGLTERERESAFRWQIVERIHNMPLHELERLVAQMEGGVMTTAQAINHALVQMDLSERKIAPQSHDTKITR